MGCAWNAIEIQLEAKDSEDADDIAKRQVAELPLASLSILELGNLYDEFGAAADHWQAIRCQPFCMSRLAYDALAAGQLADAEANRASLIKDRIAQEVRAGVPKNEQERDEILCIRIRDEIRCESRIRDRSLLREAAKVWGSAAA